MVMGESDTQDSTTSTSYTDCGLSATITPKFATSKILILVMNTVQQNSDRTRVTLHCSATGGTIHGSSNGLQAYEGNAINMACNLSYLHSPNTTSAVTYKLQAKTMGTGAFYIGRSKNDGDQDYIPRTPSSITVMEVSA